MLVMVGLMGIYGLFFRPIFPLQAFLIRFIFGLVGAGIAVFATDNLKLATNTATLGLRATAAFIMFLVIYLFAGVTYVPQETP